MSSAETQRLKALLTMRRFEHFGGEERAVFFIRPDWEGAITFHDKGITLFRWYSNDESVTGEIMFHCETQQAKKVALEIAKRIDIRFDNAKHSRPNRSSE